MMFDEISNRAHVQQLREFLLHGVDLVELEKDSPEQRLRKAEHAWEDYLRNSFPDEEDYRRAALGSDEVMTAYQNIYFELGLQAGVQLAEELLRSKQPG